MIRLVQKCGYIRQGNVAGYLKYIATRERVQKLDGNGPATAKQRQLIDRLLCDFPDSDDLFEYQDYTGNPTMENASAFISAALDVNVHSFQEGDIYRIAKAILADGEQSQDEKEKAVSNLERLFAEGFTVAAHQLGKVWRDGLCGLPDEVKAEEWFRRSAEAGNDYSQYALGKLLQGQGRIPEALEWYGKADMQGNQYPLQIFL